MEVLNRSYLRDKGRCNGPVCLPGELYTYYINFDDPISDPDFANFRLDLRKIDSDVAVKTNIGSLTKDNLNPFFYNIIVSYIFPDVPFGMYQLAIVDAVNSVTKAVSNPLLVEEEDKAVNTAFVSYRNTKDMFNTRFEANPNLYIKIRLALIETGFRIETERKQYRNVTNRRIRNYRNYKDEVIRIESYYMDRQGHRGMAAIYDHNTIFINNRFVTPKDAYNIEERLTSVLSKGSIEVIVDEEILATGAAVGGLTFLIDSDGQPILTDGDDLILVG